MGNYLSITVQGQDVFLASLSRFADRATDLRESWPKVGEVYERAVNEQFASEGGRTGGWKDLSAAYAREKAKTHPGKPIEQREGALLASLADKDATGAIFDEQPESYMRGSSLPYAVRQHESRDLFGFREDDGQEMLQIIADDLTAFANDLGLRP